MERRTGNVRRTSPGSSPGFFWCATRRIGALAACTSYNLAHALLVFLSTRRDSDPSRGHVACRQKPQCARAFTGVDRPKGYQRSDQRIREDICEHLIQSGHIDSSEVTIEIAQGVVVLEGTVPDRRMKHAIEDIAEAAPGVKDIDNRVRVSQGGQTGSETGPQQDARPGSSLQSARRAAWDSSDGPAAAGTSAARTGSGTTSSHTGGGTQTSGTATGASSGQSYGGATTRTSGSSNASGGDSESASTPSRGPGSPTELAGDSSSTPTRK